MNNINSYWVITNFLYHYPSLKSAKNDVLVGYKPSERIKYLRHQCIDHIVNNELKTSVKIRVDKKGNVTFSRPQRI